MTSEMEQQLADYLELSETGLLIEIGRTQAERPELRSPDGLIADAKAFLAELHPRLQRWICPHKDIFDLPELQLAIAIAGLLTQSLAVPLTNALAAYIVKRGIGDLCRTYVVSDD